MKKCVFLACFGLIFGAFFGPFLPKFFKFSKCFFFILNFSFSNLIFSIPGDLMPTLVILIIGGDNFIDFFIFLDILDLFGPRLKIEGSIKSVLSVRPFVTAYRKNRSKDFSDFWYEVRYP